MQEAILTKEVILTNNLTQAFFEPWHANVNILLISQVRRLGGVYEFHLDHAR